MAATASVSWIWLLSLPRPCAVSAMKNPSAPCSVKEQALVQTARQYAGFYQSSDVLVASTRTHSKETMMVDFTLNANARDDLGKGASRRLRRNADLVPAIVYGGNKEPQSISIVARELNKALENEAFYSSIIGLSIDGKKEEVLLKALQRHPAKPRVMHADFQRIVAGQKVTVQVPLHFLNEETCVGVKQEGGM